MEIAKLVDLSNRLRPILAGLLVLALSSTACRAHEALAWKRPLAGTMAFLGDDGGGADSATVCRTAAYYRKWLDYSNPPSCKQFPRGVPIVLEGVVSDAANDTMPGTTEWLPLVKIRILPDRFVGYLELMGVQPNIPQGIVVRLKREGFGSLLLAASQDADLGKGINLGDSATAELLRFDPKTGDRDLHVKVTSGIYAGRKGWVFSLDAESTDGLPVDKFDQAVVELPSPPKIDRMAKLYVLKAPLRAFKNIAVCQASVLAVSNDADFKLLEDAYIQHEYYDFPAGTQLHVVSDSDPNSPYVMVGDSQGHEGCVSRFALPGYAFP